MGWGTSREQLAPAPSARRDPIPHAAVILAAAARLGWDDRVAALEPGKLADMVAWKTNPLEDLRSLEDNANAALALKGGQVMKNLL